MSKDISEKLEKIIFNYLDSTYTKNLEWVNHNKREVELYCGNKSLLFLNTQSDFIKIKENILISMAYFFGSHRSFNLYRQVFTKWVLYKFKVQSTHELSMKVINTTLSYNSW
jgi:hypothetical protein